MRTRLVHLLPWMLVTLLFVTAAALHVRTASGEEAPDSAVQSAIEVRGERYAGDCAATVSPRDLGQVCSKLVQDRGDARAYLVGRTFSEFQRWIFVARDGTGWRVLAEPTLNFDAASLDVPW